MSTGYTPSFDCCVSAREAFLIQFTILKYCVFQDILIKAKQKTLQIISNSNLEIHLIHYLFFLKKVLKFHDLDYLKNLTMFNLNHLKSVEGKATPV